MFSSEGDVFMFTEGGLLGVKEDSGEGELVVEEGLTMNTHL